MKMVLDKSDKNLALNGGIAAISEPLPPMYPGGMRIDSEEVQEVLEVLCSRRLFRYYGPNEGVSKVETLEQRFAAYIGAPYCAAVTSGTAALICALAALAIGPGDEVVVPAYTWISTATAVLAVGAVPILGEIDESLTLDPMDVEKKITPYTKAIIAVHMRGAPCNMQKLKQIAQTHHLKLIEDVAQAAGGSYKGEKLGSIGDAGAFSLQFNKIITSGEGGLITASYYTIYQRTMMYQDVIGGLRNNVELDEMLPGLNFRMSELQGAVALVQLQRLNTLLEQMCAHKKALTTLIQDLAYRKEIRFRTIHDVEGDTSLALVFYFPEVEQAVFTASALRSEGVDAMTLYSPDRPKDFHIYCNWSSILNKRTWSPHGGSWLWHEEEVSYTQNMCPQTLDLLSRAVYLDISPDLSTDNIDEMAEALRKVLRVL